MAGEEDTQIVFELPHVFRCYKSGRVERFIGTDVIPPGVDPATSVTSKDVTLLPDVSARLFLPKIADPAKKLPVLVHFHGGVFVIQTPFSATYQNYLSSVAAAAEAVVVSVHYRRAPENPLPAAFDDSWAAFKWVVSHADGSGPEPWLADHGDFSRVFVAGESAGGNIAHQIALRAGGEEGNSAVKLAGAVLVHPYFWGTHELGPKDVNPQQWAFMERFWKFLCPGTSGADDPLINPLVGWPATMEKLAGGSVLVCVAEKDRMRPWGCAYYEALKSSGWKGTVEMFESEGEDHVFHLMKPASEKSAELKDKLVGFIKQVNNQ